MRGLMAEEVGPGAIPADVHAEMVRQHRRFGPHASRERWITVMAEEPMHARTEGGLPSRSPLRWVARSTSTGKRACRRAA